MKYLEKKLLNLVVLRWFEINVNHQKWNENFVDIIVISNFSNPFFVHNSNIFWHIFSISICRSLAVVGQFGFRLFTITSVERVEEIFCSNNEDTKIAERLFSSSLVAVVTATEADKLKVRFKNWNPHESG